MKNFLELFEVVNEDGFSEEGFNSKIMTEGEIYELADVYDDDSVDLESACNILWNMGYSVYNLRKSYPEAFEI